MATHSGTVLDFFYEEAEYYLQRGNKYATEYIPAERFHGGGWYHTSRSSKLVLKIELADGKTTEVWVDRFFKDRLGRLTKKRRNALDDTRPHTVSMTQHVSTRGTAYYQVASQELESWLSRVQEILK